MSEEVFLSSEDLNVLKELKYKAEKSAMESKIFDLEFKNAVQNVYLKYKLDPSSSIDISNGKVTGPENKEA